MKRLTNVSRVAFAFLALVGVAGKSATTLAQENIDTNTHLTSPVPHQFIHGVLGDAKFQIAMPDSWNGNVTIFSRGFSGTEFNTGQFKPTALQLGYAFASSDEGWNRVQIVNSPEDSYFESQRRLVQLTQYATQTVQRYYGKKVSRTFMIGGSNGGHHTKWMIEDYPKLFDGGLAGYGFNSQVSQWGSVATVLRNYDIIASRIDDIIAARKANPQWDPFTAPLVPPLTTQQLAALRNIYDIPATLRNGFAYNVGRWPGSEEQWKLQYKTLVGYLQDSMPRFDRTFDPNSDGVLTVDELKQWDPTKSPIQIQNDLQKLDLTGNLQRPVIIMHGTFDPVVSPGETAAYKALVEQRLGINGADDVLAVYYIPEMGHGGAQFNALIDEALFALEQWIDYRQSGGVIGTPAPGFLGIYPRE
jgi:pimeloyl-ACP methyl ester carboxylesterase